VKPIEKRIEVLEASRFPDRENHDWNLTLLGLNDLRVLRDLVEKVETGDGQHDLAKLTTLELESLKSLASKCGAKWDETT